MTPVVSVLLPYRNAEVTLGNAVRSVLGQTFRSFELIAVDDGSEDGSPDRLMAFAGDARLRAIRNDGPAGIVGALATGLRVCRGRWIARMDADDRCHPERLAGSLGRAADADEPGVVAGRVQLIGSMGGGMLRHVEWSNRLISHEEISSQRFVESPLVHPSAMIRRDWLDRAGGYRKVPWAEDHDLWLRLLEAGCRFAKVPELILDWRDSALRLTRTDPRYGEAARNRMRAHFLARIPEIQRHGVVIAGAGPTGKKLCRALKEEGVEVAGFAEVHPRRVGQKIHGVPVWTSEQALASRGQAIVLGAAGGPVFREQLRGWAEVAGLTEGRDFWQVT